MDPIFAYIDPTSGVITVQLLVAAAAGAAIFFRNMVVNAFYRLVKRRGRSADDLADRAETRNGGTPR